MGSHTVGEAKLGTGQLVAPLRPGVDRPFQMEELLLDPVEVVRVGGQAVSGRHRGQRPQRLAHRCLRRRGAGRRRFRPGPRRRRPVGPPPPRSGRPGGEAPMGERRRDGPRPPVDPGRSRPGSVGPGRVRYPPASRAAATSDSRWSRRRSRASAPRRIAGPTGARPTALPRRKEPSVPISTSGPLPVAAGPTWGTTGIDASTAATRPEATAAPVRGTSRSARVDCPAFPSPPGTSSRSWAETSTTPSGDTHPSSSPEAARAVSTPSIAPCLHPGRQLHQVPQRGPGSAVPLVPPHGGLRVGLVPGLEAGLLLEQRRLPVDDLLAHTVEIPDRDRVPGLDVRPQSVDHRLDPIGFEWRGPEGIHHLPGVDGAGRPGPAHQVGVVGFRCRLALPTGHRTDRSPRRRTPPDPLPAAAPRIAGASPLRRAGERLPGLHRCAGDGHQPRPTRRPGPPRHRRRRTSPGGDGRRPDCWPPDARRRRRR